MERSHDAARGERGVARAGRGERALRVDDDEAPQRAVEPRDAVEARARGLDRRDPAAADRRRELRDAVVDQRPPGAAITASAIVVSIRSA